MLSVALAQQLKKAGLEWEPQLHDTFAVPDRGMNERRFVITEVLAYIELFKGSPVVTFHGTAEWALDFILQTEALWVPSETQLREMIAERVDEVLLAQTADGYECRIDLQGESLTFTSGDACDAYGSALLQLLWRQAADPATN